jgi:hypothetical protein
VRFPDVSKLGTVRIESREFAVLLVDVEWDWDKSGDHDSDHAGGRCECPCSDPVELLLREAERVP